MIQRNSQVDQITRRVTPLTTCTDHCETCGIILIHLQCSPKQIVYNSAGKWLNCRTSTSMKYFTAYRTTENVGNT